MNNKVWFVTGASKGLGLSLVKQLLQQGYQVAATSRNVDDLKNAVENDSDAFLPLGVDVKSEENVKKAVDSTISRFGRIDVVVNNAGYGLQGGLEELSDKEARENFEVNVFGSLNVIRQATPHLRAQRSGHIFNISSVGGFTGYFPGFGIYCATKFAVQGFSESLAAEVKPFGINVTVVSPGYFRTNFLDSGSLNIASNPIQGYTEVRENQTLHQNQINGNQRGDPEKAVAVMIRVASEANPPLHLFLGTDAYNFVDEKIRRLQEEMETWREVATSTDLEKEHAAV